MSSPLAGRTILITRTSSQAAAFRSQLEELGATVIEVPTIEILPRITAQLDQAIAHLTDYDWVFFTSVNGVDVFCGRLAELRQEPISWPKICTIGPATTERVVSHGCQVDLQPAEYRAEGVLDEFLALHDGDLTGLRLLLPRAAVAREILPDQLRAQGAIVDLVPVYETRLPEAGREQLAEALQHSAPDLVTFTSSSTVRNFLALSEDIDRLRQLHYAVIGPITAETAREAGLEVSVMPNEYTIPALVEAIAHYFTPGK